MGGPIPKASDRTTTCWPTSPTSAHPTPSLRTGWCPRRRREGYRRLRGSRVGGELVLSGKAPHVADLGEDPPGDDRPDSVQAGQSRPGCLDQSGDLGADRRQLRRGVAVAAAPPAGPRAAYGQVP